MSQQLETFEIGLRFDGREVEIEELTEFGFSVPCEFSHLSVGENGNGTVFLGDQALDLEFRVRRISDGETKCSFWKIPIRHAETIRSFLAKRERQNSANAQLESRSYDELAMGVIDEPVQTPVAAGTTSGKKSLATVLLLLGMLAVCIVCAAFVNTRNSLSVANSALVGNYLPVNARVSGEIVQVLVNEGQHVNRGDVLMRLNNPEIELERRSLEAKRDAASEKVAAFEAQLSSFETKLGLASDKLELEYEVAESRMANAEKIKAMHRATVERLKPALKKGAVTQLEFNEADAAVAAADALVAAERLEQKSIRLAQQALKSEVLILGDRVDDQIGKLRSDLRLAKAELQELETLTELANARVSELVITAPRDGVVYASYRQLGEFLKEADQVIAISYEGQVWAAGQVTPSQANRVRPGQKVAVNIPALEMRLLGRVAAVGHRAVYSKGNYNADFRGATATDVPIKVVLEDLPSGVPSGIRLEMAITTGFGIGWLDDMMGTSIEDDRQRLKAAQELAASEPVAPIKTETKELSANERSSDTPTGGVK